MNDRIKAWQEINSATRNLLATAEAIAKTGDVERFRSILEREMAEAEAALERSSAALSGEDDAL